MDDTAPFCPDVPKLTCQCFQVGTATRCHLQTDTSSSVVQESFLVI